jgi:hypothetical protein
MTSSWGTVVVVVVVETVVDCVTCCVGVQANSTRVRSKSRIFLIGGGFEE